MMGKLVAIHRSDGGVSLLRCVSPSIDLMEPGEKLTQIVEAEISKWRQSVRPIGGSPEPASIGDYVSHTIIGDTDVPADRTFRNAWRLGVGASVVVDMNAAVEIAKMMIREARAPLLQSLDVEYIRADESGDGVRKAEIAAQKQRLRDATSDERLVAARSTQELKAAALSVAAEVKG